MSPSRSQRRWQLAERLRWTRRRWSRSTTARASRASRARPRPSTRTRRRSRSMVATGARPSCPALAPLAGLLYFFGKSRKTTPESSRGRPVVDHGASSHDERTFTRRQSWPGLGLPLAGSAVLGRRDPGPGRPDHRTDRGGARPAGTPASLCLPLAERPGATTPVDGSDCLRGAVPVTLRIEAIGVDAPVEILETVGGVMQQPSRRGPCRLVQGNGPARGDRQHPDRRPPQLVGCPGGGLLQPRHAASRRRGGGARREATPPTPTRWSGCARRATSNRRRRRCWG